MQLGMNTATLGVDIFEAIRWIREHGFEFVELSCGEIPNRNDYIHPGQINAKFVQKLKDACAEFELITLHPETPSAFLVSDSGTRLRAIEEMSLFIDLAAELGSQLLTFHSGSASDGVSDREVRELCAESFGLLAGHARQRGVRLSLEVVPGYFATAESFEILDQLELADLGITLDIGHISFPHPLHSDKACYFPLAGIGEFIEGFANRLTHLHVHDYDGRHDHIAIGEGAIDFADIVVSLREIGYDRTICFEFTPKVPRQRIVESKEKWRGLVSRYSGTPHPMGSL